MQYHQGWGIGERPELVCAYRFELADPSLQQVAEALVGTAALLQTTLRDQYGREAQIEEIPYYLSQVTADSRDTLCAEWEEMYDPVPCPI